MTTNPCVLLVEDNPITRKLVRAALYHESIDLLEAGDGASAMDAARGRRPDLILQDLVLPDTDGFDLVRRLRAEADGPNHTTAVMLASGYTPLSKIARARDIGANMVILKPISPVVLLSHIEWLAKAPRPFVSSPGYCGPCRRVRQQPLPAGISERRAEAHRMGDLEIHGAGEGR